jgi:hypothetical protein
MSEIQFLIVSVSRKSLGIRSKGILRRQCPLLADFGPSAETAIDPEQTFTNELQMACST